MTSPRSLARLGGVVPVSATGSRSRRVSPPCPVDPAESREFNVAAALSLAGPTAPVEVYVDLGDAAMRVVLRGSRSMGVPWQVAGPLLRQLVLAALAPLLTTGWRLDGPFPAAARWDVSVVSGPDLYRGCWVRMRRDAA